MQKSMIDQLSNDMYDNSTKLDKISPPRIKPLAQKDMRKFDSAINNDGSRESRRSNSEPKLPQERPIRNEQLMIRRQGVSNPHISQVREQEKKRVEWISSPRMS